jgi:hypothetical protein
MAEHLLSIPVGTQSRERTPAARAAELLAWLFRRSRYRFLAHLSTAESLALTARGAVRGLRSGGAVHEDVELIPLWVGHDHPAGVRALSDVGPART